MTYRELTQILTESMLFTTDEVRQIIACCGTASIGNAVITCEILGIELFGNDIDILYSNERPKTMEREND